MPDLEGCLALIEFASLMTGGGGCIPNHRSRYLYNGYFSVLRYLTVAGWLLTGN